MKHVLQSVFLCVLIASCQPSVQTPSTHLVQGRAVLVDSTSQTDWHRDMSATVVTVSGTSLQTVTDSNGYFIIEGVPDGSDVFEFTHPGYGVQRSTPRNLYQYPSTDQRPFVAVSVALFPITTLTAAITSAAIHDSTYSVVEGHWQGQVISASGDTIEKGTFVVDDTRTEHDTLLVVRGVFHGYPSGFQGNTFANVLLVMGRDASVSDDSNTYDVVLGMFTSSLLYNHELALSDADSSFAFRIYASQLGAWVRGGRFRSGQPVFCRAYAIPAFENSYEDGQGTIFRGSGIESTTARFGFSTIHNASENMVSFIMP